MAYTPQTWHDLPATDTPITAARLGHLEQGLVDAHAALAARPQLVKVTTGTEIRPGGSGSVIWLVTDPDITEITHVDPVNDLIVRPAAGGDSTAPTVPTGLAASSITETGFHLTWSASTDDTGVTGYEVQANGVTVATPATNSADITGRTASTTYAVRVRAKDAAGNWSAWSSSINVTTLGGGLSTMHSVWGSSAPAGTWAANTDGTPSIEYGNCFYRFGSGSGWYAAMRIVGGKVYKPEGISLPAGTVTMRWYVNSGPLPTPTPASGFGGAAAASKTVNVADLADGWNAVMLDTPIDMPANAAVVVVTVQWNGNDDFYLVNASARAGNSALVAADGTKLAWSEEDLGAGYVAKMWKIGTGYGTPSSSSSGSYGTDLLVDEGPA